MVRWVVTNLAERRIFEGIERVALDAELVVEVKFGV